MPFTAGTAAARKAGRLATTKRRPGFVNARCIKDLGSASRAAKGSAGAPGGGGGDGITFSAPALRGVGRPIQKAGAGGGGDCFATNLPPLKRETRFITPPASQP